MGPLNASVHAFFALLAGFAAMALLAVLLMSLTRLRDPGYSDRNARLRPAPAFVSLGYSFIAAAAGGYVTAWIAGLDALRFILVFAVGVLILAAISALQTRDKQPASYAVAMLIVSPLGALIGGFARLRATGIF